MATRSRTRSGAAKSSAKPESVKHTKQAVKKEESPAAVLHDGAKPSSKPHPTKSVGKRGKGKVSAVVPEVVCTCSRGHDGDPMIHCAECNKWYHFVCVDLAERDADDITLFICPPCSKATGLCSTMSWEGLDAFEEREGPTHPKTRAQSRTKTPAPPKSIPSEESAESGASEDEYVADENEEPVKDRSKSSKKRTVNAVQSSEPESDGDIAPRKRTRRFTKSTASSTPKRQGDIKRKASMSDARTPLKKQKSISNGSDLDATRRYCLGKFEEVFKKIFLAPLEKKEETAAEGTTSNSVASEPLDELTDEQKEAVEKSKTFAADLERCIFEGYADHDKVPPTAGSNYKDRVLMLTFNLGQKDRDFIHQRIISSSITPKELSAMSSAELADEASQQERKKAEQEALEHSILQKIVAPRAKITHKGLQDIEYHDEPVTIPAPSNDVQLRKEAEAEERRERERNARLKPQQRQRTMSVSVPSESASVPPTPTADSWGAPPPVPGHSRDVRASPSQQTAQPLFVRTGSDMVQDSPAPELNLADLINIEEVSPTSEILPAPPVSTITPVDHATDAGPFSPPSATDFQTPPSPTAAFSPFAYPASNKQSFNLSTLWTNNKEQQDEDDAAQHPMSTTPPPLSPPTMKDDAFDEDDMVESPVEQDDEQDFDMFLDEPAPEKAPEGLKPVEALPEVWKGKISMPLDSTILAETPIVARQIAGTPLQTDSLLWKTLFPSDPLRIDGRVAVESSAKYLLQMRLNAAKELYAVVLSPASEADEAAFKTTSDFLTSKGRHGLVFPWGSRPKEHHPGRELYMIPLAANEPIPEYIELLDNLQLPKDRTRNYMIGIWILNKGKLAPPPPAPSPAPLQPKPLNPLQHAMPPASTYTGNPSSTPHAPNPLGGTPPSIYHPPPPPMSNSRGGIPQAMYHPSPPPSIPNPHGDIYQPAYRPTPPPIAPPPHIPSSTPTAPAVPPAPVAAIDPAALAAEVASLTPEQIQNVLRTLQLTGTNPATIPGLPQLAAAAAGPPPRGPIPPAYPPPYHPGGGHPPPPPPHQPWQAAAPTPPYPHGYPPYPAPPPPPPPRHGDYAPRPQHDDWYDRERNYPGDRDGNAWRGRGRGRGPWRRMVVAMVVVEVAFPLLVVRQIRAGLGNPRIITKVMTSIGKPHASFGSSFVLSFSLSLLLSSSFLFFLT
ncbi:hypothetical protein DFP72DRAFT_628969 [Ephemerocybe angulata]|uniref:Transcription factor BYE1 n=1 Tax=Ephemerocybe angulata TaxID=980116 RepID=A0A8H6IA20_9AGAR|nr:hypothetical protein DFP72DRAFT_628969 [Tulosesus angulatus]